MIADLTRRRALVEALERLGYDAMTVGNHEPDFGPETLAQYVREMRFPVVAANLVSDGGRPPTRPYVIRRVGEVRVGILGLAYPKTAWTSAAKNVEGLEFQDPVEPTQDDSLMADILRAETGAEVAFLPGVGYGVGIPPGPITAAMLRQLVPHNGKVVTMRLSGSQILAILEQSVENTFSEDPRAKVGGMIQVSGIRFAYDLAPPPGRRVIRVERTEGPWNAEKDFVVATNSMLADGGHRYAAFREGRNRAERGSQFETVKAHFRAHSPVGAPDTGRIVRAS